MKKAKVDWKSFTWEQKKEYIWDYYKIHIILALLVVCFGIYIGVKIANHRDPLMRTIMFNCYNSSVSSETVFEEFLTENGYEVYSNAVQCHSSLSFWEIDSEDSSMFQSAQYENGQLMQAYYALLATKNYSVVFGSGWVFDYTVSEDGFVDLSEVLPEETLELYADYLIYCVDEEEDTKYPCAIRLTEENGWIQEHAVYQSCAVGILRDAPDQQMAVELIRYLLAENMALLTEETS